MPLVDVFLLAALYSIRLYAGGVATLHEVSLWLMAFSGFLFLALALMKRVTELGDLRARGGVYISRRGYNVSDQQILTSFGTASSFVSATVLALYVQSDAAAALGHDQRVLWAVVPLLLFWQLRLWLATARGYMPDDPIVYTAKDWVSALVAASLIGTVILGQTVF
jgi:4-hydroxybenzoate polyprenyltransferase